MGNRAINSEFISPNHTNLQSLGTSVVNQAEMSTGAIDHTDLKNMYYKQQLKNAKIQKSALRVNQNH